MLLDALKKNQNIITLNLAGNEVSETILNDIENCLRNNSKLAGPMRMEDNHVEERTFHSNTIRQERGRGCHQNIAYADT